MAQPPTTGPSIRANVAKEARDWANVGIAFVALFVAIISLWTTIKVSGLEDYFQSEIVRRNAELKRIAARSDMLEQVALARSERLSTLQASADAAMSRFTEAQQRLIFAQGDLAKVRGDAAVAAANLADARRASAETATKLSEQSGAFDLFSRTNALEYATLNLAMDITYDDDDPPSGMKALRSINSLTAPKGQRLLQPYLDRLKSNVPQVCPGLANWKAQLPNVPPEPPKPTISYMSNASQAEIARLTSAALEKYMRETNDRQNKRTARIDAISAAYRTLNGMARSCMCRALADEKFGAEQVCPLTS